MERKRGQNSQPSKRALGRYSFSSPSLELRLKGQIHKLKSRSVHHDRISYLSCEKQYVQIQIRTRRDKTVHRCTGTRKTEPAFPRHNPLVSARYTFMGGVNSQTPLGSEKPRPKHQQSLRMDRLTDSGSAWLSAMASLRLSSVQNRSRASINESCVKLVASLSYGGLATQLVTALHVGGGASSCSVKDDRMHCTPFAYYTKRESYALLMMYLYAWKAIADVNGSAFLLLTWQWRILTAGRPQREPQDLCLKHPFGCSQYPS